MNGEKLFYGTATVICMVIAALLLFAGPAKGADLDAINRYRPPSTASVFDGSINVYEFTPTTAQGMQCVFVVGNYGGSTFCWPKIMNTEVQKWIERMEEREN